MSDKVERLKSEGHYEEAGRVARLLGRSDTYGCHYGMRSQLDFARRSFLVGWRSIDDSIRIAGVVVLNKESVS